MGRSSQRKGRAGELELARLLSGYGYDVKPGAAENYGREPDLSGIPGIHIECKRCERLLISEWMEQAQRDAERFHDGTPVVFHRRSREPWRVTMNMADFMQILKGVFHGENKNGFR